MIEERIDQNFRSLFEKRYGFTTNKTVSKSLFEQLDKADELDRQALNESFATTNVEDEDGNMITMTYDEGNVTVTKNDEVVASADTVDEVESVEDNTDEGKTTVEESAVKDITRRDAYLDKINECGNLPIEEATDKSLTRLGNVKGSATQILIDNLDAINATTNATELNELLKDLFTDLDTHWTQAFLAKAARMPYAEIIKYVYNSILKGDSGSKGGYYYGESLTEEAHKEKK